jgi:hypothetical protein
VRADEKLTAFLELEVPPVVASQERRRTNATVRGRQLGRDSLLFIGLRACA